MMEEREGEGEGEGEGPVPGPGQGYSTACVGSGRYTVCARALAVQCSVACKLHDHPCLPCSVHN
jgi:hypothetical protein